MEGKASSPGAVKVRCLAGTINKLIGRQFFYYLLSVLLLVDRHLLSFIYYAQFNMFTESFQNIHILSFNDRGQFIIELNLPRG